MANCNTDAKQCERKAKTTGKRCKGKSHSLFDITLPSGKVFRRWLCPAHEKSLRKKGLTMFIVNPEVRAGSLAELKA